MNLLLRLLLAFLFPAIAGEGEGEGQGEGGQGEGEGEGEGDDINLDLGEGEGEGSGGGDQDPAALLAREREERKAEKERYDRELGELRARSQALPPAAPPADKEFEREEQILKDPNSTELQKWQIQANRELRAGRQQSAMAMFQAQDLSDKTAFQQLSITKPAIFKKYGSRVEEELAKMRKNGGNAPREGILAFLIGKDAMDGNLKPKKKAAASGDQTGGTNASGASRGRLPGARSDVTGRTTMSEHEKRAKRLENVQI